MTGSRDSNPRVLQSIAEAIIGEVQDPAAPTRAAQVMARMLERLPSADRRLLYRILNLLDAPLGAFLLTGRPTSFSSRSTGDRAALLKSWSQSRLGFRRQLFQVFKRLALVGCYAAADERGTNPVWAALGYPGPVTKPPEESKAITPFTLQADTTLTCDAVVVGSGAGGGVAAAELARAGKDVVVLEQGGYFNEADFNQRELEMLGKLYLDGSTTATADLGVSIFAGSCLGGGTVINYTTSFRTPDWLRIEWDDRCGRRTFATDEYGASLDAVCAALGVNADHNRVSQRERVIERGLEALNWHVGIMPRNVRGCTQDARCGFCGYGCQLGAKQSTLKTYLLQAHQQGARIVVECRADRVLVEAGRAMGVEATARSPEGKPVRVRIRSGAVVVAAGAIGTPALLLRSGLRSRALGQGLRLHPVTAVWGVFDELIRPWEGTIQAIYSDQFADLDGRHHGAKLESAPVHPSLMALVAPWQSAAQAADLMRRLPHVVPLGILLRDRDGGRVTVEADGMPRTHYRPSRFDLSNVRRAIEGCARVLEAAGAREIFSSQTAFVSYRPGQRGGLSNFIARVDRHGYGPGQMTFVSFHQMASCGMGQDPSTSVVGSDHQCHAARGLFVADASAFPSASGVNPMITIMAMAHRASRFIASAC